MKAAFNINYKLSDLKNDTNEAFYNDYIQLKLLFIRDVKLTIYKEYVFYKEY